MAVGSKLGKLWNNCGQYWFHRWIECGIHRQFGER